MVTTDAPGLKRKRNQDGTFRYYWEARTDLVKRGYRPSSVRLHYPDTPDGDLQRSARCRMLWAEMLSWASHGGAYPQRGYDGSLGSLCRLFQTDEGSPYRRAKWNVQRLYDGTFKIILATVANRQVRNLIGPDFARWHEKWAEPTGEGRPRRLTRAGHCMTTVRRVISYGVTLGYDDCIRTDIILKKMRFEAARPRTSKMTFDQLGAIRAKAHEMNLGSVALATTLQFELALRQKDVIGEWLPCAEGEGGIVHKSTRWANGLTWSDIGPDMILRKNAVKTNIAVEHDLKLYPAVMEEIARVPPERRVGPLIISEPTGEPYKHRTFTQTFRRVANAAGVPKGVWNMDARAGAISEAYDAGAAEAEVMKHAGHTNRQTSARYNRGSLEQTSRVAKMRQAKRTGNNSKGRPRDV